MKMEDYQKIELQCWLSLKDADMGIVKDAIGVLVNNQNENMRFIQADAIGCAVINIEEVGTI